MYLRDSDESPSILPDNLYIGEMTTPSEMRHNPISCVTTKFIRQSTNKIKCPIFCVAVSITGVAVKCPQYCLVNSFSKARITIYLNILIINNVGVVVVDA